MYKLTLTRDERKAIDWLGECYRHGHELYTLLCVGDWTTESGNELTADWDCADALVITMPEYIAWEVKELIDDSLIGGKLDCFCDDFTDKLLDWCRTIV